MPPPTLGSDDDTPAGVWAGPGGDLRNTRFAAVAPIRDPTVRWESPFAGFVGGVTGDRLRLTRPGPADERAALAAYAPADGTVEWEREIEHSIAAPWSDGSTLYASGTGRIRRIDPDGQLGWTHDLYATLGERVHGSFLPATRDHFRVSPPIVSTVAVAADVVYDGVGPTVDASPTDPHLVADEAGVLALDAETGERLWFVRMGFVPDDLAVVDAHVVAWDRDRNLAVLAETSVTRD